MILKNLRKLRKERNLTLLEVANNFHIAEGTMSAYETGRREPNGEMSYDEEKDKIKLTLICNAGIKPAQITKTILLDIEKSSHNTRMVGNNKQYTNFYFFKNGFALTLLLDKKG